MNREDKIKDLIEKIRLLPQLNPTKEYQQVIKDTGEFIIGYLEQLLSKPSYEQGLERGRQIGYKEGWKAKADESNDVVEKSEAYKLVCSECGGRYGKPLATPPSK